MEAYARYSKMTAADDAADLGPNVKLIARHHDIVGGQVTVIFESDSLADVTKHVYNWLPVFDNITITPVLDDEEARRVIREKSA